VSTHHTDPAREARIAGALTDLDAVAARMTPAQRARTADYLAGDLPAGPTMEDPTMPPEPEPAPDDTATQVTIRLTQSLRDRIEALMPLMPPPPPWAEGRARGPNLSAAARWVLCAGLDAIEEAAARAAKLAEGFSP